MLQLARMILAQVCQFDRFRNYFYLKLPQTCCRITKRFINLSQSLTDFASYLPSELPAHQVKCSAILVKKSLTALLLSDIFRSYVRSQNENESR